MKLLAPFKGPGLPPKDAGFYFIKTVCVRAQVYLVDYGLAYRYSPEGVLKEYKEDPKRCHDGTIEFTSIDAHKGVGMPFRLLILTPFVFLK